MSTLTLNLSDEQKQFIKQQAAFKQTTIKDLVLQAVGYLSANSNNYREYTTDDFNEETLEAIREMEENRDTLKRYDDVEELFTDILGTSWKDA